MATAMIYWAFRMATAALSEIHEKAEMTPQA